VLKGATAILALGVRKDEATVLGEHMLIFMHIASTVFNDYCSGHATIPVAKMVQSSTVNEALRIFSPTAHTRQLHL